MNTREDIIQFYEQYKKNLDEENNLLETVVNIESEKDWIKKAKLRKEGLGKLYYENMKLLNMCVLPYINHDEELNDEIAEEFLNQCTDFCWHGYLDRLAGLSVISIVEEYYEKNNNISLYIQALHIKSVFCIALSSIGGLEEAHEAIVKELKYLDKYLEIEDFKTRSRLIAGLFNYCLSLLNMVLFTDLHEVEKAEWIQKELLLGIKRIVSFYSDEKVIALDGDKIDFNEKMDIIANQLCGNAISDIGLRFPLNTELLEYSTQKVTDYYYKEIMTHDELEFSDTLACVYYTCQYRSGYIEYDEFVNKYFTFCKNVILKEEKIYRYRSNDELFNSNYFRITTYNLPYFLQYLDKSKMSEESYNEIVMLSVERFLDLLDWLPHFRNFQTMSLIIEQGAFEIIKYLPKNVSPYNLIVKVLFNRDETTLLHSTMVRRCARILIDYIFRTRADILVGLFNTENVVEVLKKQEMITEYLSLSALIFDLGKIKYTDILTKETRDVTEEENALVRNHPIDGYNMIKDIEHLNAFKDVILGHHKSYDGKSGYPMEFDNTKSDVRVIIDIIKICDVIEYNCYRLGKFDKFGRDFIDIIIRLKKGAGTDYNPDIINLIANDKSLQNELYACCIEDREKVYYETYFEFLGKTRQTEEKKDELQFTGFAKQAKNTMHNMLIDLYKDTIMTTYFGSNSVFTDRIFCSFKEFITNMLAPITHEEDKPKIMTLLNYGSLADKFSSNDNYFELEIRVMVKNEWRWHRISFVVVEEEYGIPEKVVVAMNDIDPDCRRRLQVLDALEEAKEEAKAANSSKSLFISNISHEIRTPMNAIVGMVEIMLREDMPQNQKGYLMNIRNSGNALLSIINDILDFSKMESGKLEIIEDEYEMMSLLNDMSMIFLNRIGEKPVELIFDIDKNIPELLYGDVVRIRQVIINIMNNAIKFTDKGMVRLKMQIMSKVNDMIELGISIKDTGIGIKEEEIPKLFGAFQQVDIKRNRQLEGTGLGLVISKQLVELMGGSINVHSEYGKGTEFYFTIEQKVISHKRAVDINLSDEDKNSLVVASYFDNDIYTENLRTLCNMYDIKHIDLVTNSGEPFSIVFTEGINLPFVKSKVIGKDAKICVIQNPMMESIKDKEARIVNKPLYFVNFCHIVNDEEDTISAAKTDEYLDFCAPNAKILIVDDTQMNLTVAKGLLQPLKLQIDTAEDGRKAIEMIQRKRYDLVFMDHKMPVMDGVEATELIRKIEGDYYKEVPIIALTANAVLDARDSFRKAGMNDFVAKPIEMKNICSKIKKWLPKELIVKRKTGEGETLDFSEISIPGIKGIDIQEGVKNSGSIELFMTLLHDYYKLIDVKSAKIKQLLEEEDIKNYTIEVHAMKSTSRMIGALQLSEKFKQLEEWGDANDKDSIVKETPKILEEFYAYKDYLKDFIKRREDESNNNEKVKIDKSELIEILETLGMAIQSCDLDMMDECMNRLEKCSIPEDISEKVEQLKILTADFAMEEIVKVTHEIIQILRK